MQFNLIICRFQMLTSLYSKGANSLWEHSLLHPSNSSNPTSVASSGFSSPLNQANKNAKRKPSPKDPIHPVKSEFIRAKYQLQSFIPRPTKDETPCSSDDVSQVRTKFATCYDRMSSSCNIYTATAFIRSYWECGNISATAMCWGRSQLLASGKRQPTASRRSKSWAVLAV